MLKEPISITALCSNSALGSTQKEVWDSYLSSDHKFSKTKIGAQEVWAAPLPESVKNAIEALRSSDSKYRNLDDTVLFAIHTAQQAIRDSKWEDSHNFGVNVGSSRGATSLFEKYHAEFLRNGKSATLSSPTTTLGNISSWVAHDLKTKGPEISHSITCSTALHALLNAVAWIQSGMTDQFLVGGSEAPLTPFTIAQMQALKIYAEVPPRDVSLSLSKGSSRDNLGNQYPCQALDLSKKQNSMVLGEGAAMACLEKGKDTDTLAFIEGVGFATEPLEHNVSISTEAQCFQDSMKMALGELNPRDVDAIVLHAPGTIKGDLSEYKAIQQVFGESIPFLTTNKWKVGHTFGASGLLSLEMGILMMQHQKYIPVPFFEQAPRKEPIRRILVNAVGFGGNAVSVLLRNPKDD